MTVLAGIIDRIGTVRAEFDCCDTTFVVRASGFRAVSTVSRAHT